MVSTRKVECPECGSYTELECPLEIGATAVCFGCDSLLKIVGLDPLDVEVEITDGFGYSEKGDEVQ